MENPENLEIFCWDPNLDAMYADGMSAGSEEPPEIAEAKRRCQTCQESLPFDDFYKNSTGKDGFFLSCKTCCCLRKRKERHDSLYIMENPRIPGEIKIGRSQDPEERAKQLSVGQNFRIVLKRSYGEKGFLEKTIHQRLKSRRVDEGTGTEWFKVSVDQADLVIRAAILEDELAKPSED